MTLRKYVDRGLLPIARRVTISPNAITAMAFLTMAGASTLVVADSPRWAGMLIVASGLLDLLDGAVARATARSTRFGALLDRVADRAGDFMIIGAIVIAGHVDVALGIYTLSVTLLASYISACLEAATASEIGGSISLRGVRLVILVASCLSGAFFEGMILLAVIGTYASVARLRLARSLLR